MERFPADSPNALRSDRPPTLQAFALSEAKRSKDERIGEFFAHLTVSGLFRGRIFNSSRQPRSGGVYDLYLKWFGDGHKRY